MNKLILKKRKKRIRLKLFLFIFLFILIITITFKYLLSKNINYDNDLLIKLLLNSSCIKVKNNNIRINMLDVLNINYLENDITKKSKVVKTSKKVNQKYLIYIYNTHQNEEYRDTTLINNSITPTVSINDYIMKDYFDNRNLTTLVENKSVNDALNINNYKYYRSYEITKMFMTDAKNNYKTLKYYIDIHRDSLPRDKTTIDIDGKSYARVLFLIGLENDNYEDNLNFTSIINNKLNTEYPSLSKGILKKGGEGVNGVYNQDFSPYTILIEIGGYENTIEEVMNTSIALSKVISEVIIENENRG